MGEHERGTVSERLTRIERTLARMEARLDKALGPIDQPTAVTDPNRGRFAPGSGWIPNDPPPTEPPADETTAYEALAAMRATLHPITEEGE